MEGIELPDIVIPHHNRADRLQECLRNIPLEYNVYVIRGGTFAENNNKGFKLTKSKYVLFCNDDVVLNKKFLTEITVSNKKLIGALQIDPAGNVLHARWLFYCPGGCFRIERELFEKIGGFCEEYRNGHEDRDLFLKIIEQGYRLHTTKSAVLHYGSQSTGRFDNEQHNNTIFNQRWPLEKLKALALPTITVITTKRPTDEIMFPESLSNQEYPKDKIQWIIEEDTELRGANFVRNKALEKATGDLIFFFDPDLKLHHACFKVLATRLLQNPQCDWAYCNFKLKGIFEGKEHVAKPFNFAALKEKNYISGVSLIRREAFPYPLNESIKRLQDWDWYLTMSSQGKQGFWEDEYLFEAYYKEGDMSTNSSYQSYIEVRKLHPNIFEHKHIPEFIGNPVYHIRTHKDIQKPVEAPPTLYNVPKEEDRILLLTPFRNEAHSLDNYIQSVKSIKYPHNLIDIFWLENDSSDGTLELLDTAREELKDFNNVKLTNIRIKGPVKKQETLSYVKDEAYGMARLQSWYVIWNDYFIPYIRLHNAKYVLVFFADAVAPGNIIEEYIKVFNEHKDCGWVGGVQYRRYPRQAELVSPYNTNGVIPKEISQTTMCGHCWMMKSDTIKDAVVNHSQYDVHYSIVYHLNRQGLFVYCNPDVRLRHVSNDGKIYD